MSSAAERHRAADRGRGAVGAGQSRPGSPGRSRSRGAAVSGGARTPLGGDESRRASSTGANPGGGRGAPRRLLAAEPDRDRPRRMDTGGAGGAGHRGSGALVVVDRRGGDRAGPWAAAGEGGGVEGLGGLGGEPREAPGLGEGSRGRPFLEGGGGGLLPARGTTGAPLERGGGRACIARCRAMSIHGRAAWDYIPNPPRRSRFFRRV